MLKVNVSLFTNGEDGPHIKFKAQELKDFLLSTPDKSQLVFTHNVYYGMVPASEWLTIDLETINMLMDLDKDCPLIHSWLQHVTLKDEEFKQLLTKSPNLYCYMPHDQQLAATDYVLTLPVTENILKDVLEVTDQYKVLHDYAPKHPEFISLIVNKYYPQNAEIWFEAFMKYSYGTHHSDARDLTDSLNSFITGGQIELEVI